MLDFLFKKKEVNKSEMLNELYPKLKELYGYDKVSEAKREYLCNLVKEFGYLPYPYIRALEELSVGEVLVGLEEKWKQNGIFDGEKFNFENNKISVLVRNDIKSSDWIKREGHDIKLINLAGLGNGNTDEKAGKFIDWLRQLLILPTGNLQNGIMNTTLYLIPFHPREFGCAYLPTSTDVSRELYDKSLPLSAKEQVQVFVTLAQLAGHPVIYDILPQTGRFAKVILANPYVARWYDITALLDRFKSSIGTIAEKLSQKYDREDVDIVKDIFIQMLHSGAGDLTEHYQEIFDEFEIELSELKKKFSNEMLEYSNQLKLQKRVREIVAKIHDKKADKKFAEEDIIKQGEATQALIDEGLWPAPGGAWCSAGIPVFDKMSECGTYPMFIHYNFKGEDVTNFANLDCQTPFYFVQLENGKYNDNVIDFFVKFMQKLQSDYNFDGFRVDHIDHVVDEVSQKDGVPISYRAPAVVLKKLNDAMKANTPYFASLAEYMLWDNYLKEYHEDMNFDILWGNDIVSQFEKTPEKITEDNAALEVYNNKNAKLAPLSILKTYNNQDGEFKEIDQYPGQLTPRGAIFKWFKYKFLPGGKNAQRPMFYIDGDESFTANGIEHVIGNEVSMIREKNYDFYVRFDAIDRFVKGNEIITDGEAQIITQDEDGFVSWLITKEPLKQAFLVVANYNYPSEKVTIDDGQGFSHTELKISESVFDKAVRLPCDWQAIAEYKFREKDFVKLDFEKGENSFEFGELKPSEYKIYLLSKV